MNVETILKDVTHVYHATSKENLEGIKEQGLKTNSAINKTNFGFLSKSHSIYFSTNPKHAKKFVVWYNEQYHRKSVVLEIPVEELKDKHLVVDENFIDGDYCPDGKGFRFGETCIRLIDETNMIAITNFKVLDDGELNNE